MIREIKNNTFLDKHVKNEIITRKFKLKYYDFINGLTKQSSLEKINSYSLDFINSRSKIKISKFESELLKSAGYLAISTSGFWYNETKNPKSAFYEVAINYDNNDLNITSKLKINWGKVLGDVAGFVGGTLFSGGNTVVGIIACGMVSAGIE